jgi:hypothetical protein
MSYDTGRRHGHMNGLNIGLFAHGRDLLPDFGYPPVHLGGWSGPRFDWYKATAAHNTVLVDGRNQEQPAEGATKLWGSGQVVQTIKVSAPACYGIERYDRMLVLVHVSPSDFYVLDVFGVEGGADHAWFLRGPESSMSTNGLTLSDADNFGHDTLMRNVVCDAELETGLGRILAHGWEPGDHDSLHRAE